MRQVISILSILLLVFLPITAFSKWYEASSDHFVIYANDSEKDVRRFSEQLEQYHAAMVKLTNADLLKPSPSNRVSVFVVKNRHQVKKLFGDGGKNVGGFYIPRSSGSIAIVPRITLNSRKTPFSMIILLHEYAHHFLTSSNSYAAPSWFSEGSAEFFASALFKKNGSLQIGLPAGHRANELLYAKDIKVKELLDPSTFERLRKRGRSFESFYGKSWLLYHYLTFNEERQGQLVQYLYKIAEGLSSLDAGAEAFGSLADLEKELDSYLRQKSMTSFLFEKEDLEIGTFSVRPLRKGEIEIMNVRVRSYRGVNREQALEVVSDARKIASEFPNDPVVMASLAEAEYDSGNDAAAITAADAAIALDKNQVRAYVQKGYALFRIALSAEDPEVAYKTAVAPFLALNKIEPDYPTPLLYYYLSFIAQNKEPTDLALEGLQRALELAPFDVSLRMQLVTQQIQDRHYKQASRTLSPVAFNSHGDELALRARKMIELIDQGFSGEPSELMLLLQN